MEHFKFLRNLIIAVAGILIAFFVLSHVGGREVLAPENPDKVVIEQPPYELSVTSEKGVVIYVTSPNKDIASGSPLIISGRAPGNWFFEASAPVTLTNWDGLIIAEGYMTAKGDWMTTDYVPFEGTLVFPEGNMYERGFLIFKKDNPSGESKFDDSAEIMIKII